MLPTSMLFNFFLNEFQDCLQFSSTSMYTNDVHTNISDGEKISKDR